MSESWEDEEEFQQDFHLIQEIMTMALRKKQISNMIDNNHYKSPVARKEVKSTEASTFQFVIPSISLLDLIKNLKEMYLSEEQALTTARRETFNQIYCILETSFNCIVRKRDFQILEDNYNQDILEFLYFFNDHFNRKTLEIIQSQDIFAEDTKLALNCWNVSINIIGLCCSVGTRREKGEDKINVMKLVFKYVDEYLEFVRQNIVARRIVEVALYCLCNYFHGRTDLIKEEIHEKDLMVYKNCFSLDNNFQEIKLSSGIILSYILRSDPLSQEILDHLTNIKVSNTGGEYLGISGEIMTTAINNLQIII